MSELRTGSLSSVPNRLRLARLDVAVLILTPLACVMWTLHAGRDLNWDLINYHYYVAYSFVADRLAQDFMPASIQSYLNPIAYLPFYWMVQAGWHSALISGALALLHSLNLVLLYLISRRLFVEHQRLSPTCALLATAMGAVTPFYWAEVGTSFNDVSTSVFVLTGIYLLLSQTSASQLTPWSVSSAGMLLGLAAGMKLTNLVFAAPALALVLATPLASGANFKRLCLLGIGTVAGFLVTDGFWAYRLYQEFGNPVFPFYNGLFASPDFPAVSFSHDLFRPHTLLDSLTFPFRIIQFKSWVYSETITPELRLAGFTLLGITAAMLWPFQARRQDAADTPERQTSPAITRFQWFYLGALIVWLALWANGRYFMVGWLLIGPALMALALALLPKRRAFALVALLATFQGVYAADAGNPRWSPTLWGTTWFETEAPDRLRNIPYLYLNLGMQSYSFVIPSVHPQSAFVNLVGQYSISLDGPGGERVRKLMARFSGHVRSLSLKRPTESGQAINSKSVADLDSLFSRVGLKLDVSDCETISSANPIMRFEGGLTAASESPIGTPRMELLSCALVPENAVHAETDHERQRVTRVFNLIEKACPRFFSPAQPALERGAQGWTRFYFRYNTFLMMPVTGEDVFYFRIRELRDTYLGKLSDWEAGRVQMPCPR